MMIVTTLEKSIKKYLKRHMQRFQNLWIIPWLEPLAQKYKDDEVRISPSGLLAILVVGLQLAFTVHTASFEGSVDTKEDSL